ITPQREWTAGSNCSAAPRNPRLAPCGSSFLTDPNNPKLHVSAFCNENTHGLACFTHIRFGGSWTFGFRTCGIGSGKPSNGGGQFATKRRRNSRRRPGVGRFEPQRQYESF